MSKKEVKGTHYLTIIYKSPMSLNLFNSLFINYYNETVIYPDSKTNFEVFDFANGGYSYSGISNEKYDTINYSGLVLDNISILQAELIIGTLVKFIENKVYGKLIEIKGIIYT